MPLIQSEVQERIKKLFGERSARTGGKGTSRRKNKAVSKVPTQDDKRLNSQLKRLNVTQIPAIEEVNLFKDDGHVVHFTKPKVQAEISSNTYVVQGEHATKKLEDLFPDILPQLGGESIEKLKNLAQVLKQANFGAAEQEVPTLVDENFEEVAKRDEKEENAEKTSGDKAATQSTEEKKEVPQASATSEVPQASATSEVPTTTGAPSDANTTATTTMQPASSGDANTTNATSETNQPKTETVALEPDPNQAVSV